jgi:GntR family transcriptional regulator
MINFVMDKQSSVPFYRQIIDQALAGVASGRIVPGERLPTIRDLAVQLGVNPNTVVKAYAELEALGVADTQQGSGVYVRPGAPVAPDSKDHRRAVDELCRDFVGRAHMLNIRLDELLACLKAMKKD